MVTKEQVENKNDFRVYTYTTYDRLEDVPMYCHWSHNLKMVIIKNGVKMEFDSDEVRQIVKSLPRTIGGSY